MIHRGLAREPSDRYASAAEMCEALVPWADERSRAVVNRVRHRASAAGRGPLVQGELGSRSTSTSTLAEAGATGPRTSVESGEAFRAVAVTNPERASTATLQNASNGVVHVAVSVSNVVAQSMTSTPLKFGSVISLGMFVGVNGKLTVHAPLVHACIGSRISES